MYSLSSVPAGGAFTYAHVKTAPLHAWPVDGAHWSNYIRKPNAAAQFSKKVGLSLVSVIKTL